MLLAAALVCATGAAPAVDRSESTNGGFGAKLLIVSDTDAFWKEWEQPDTPHITTTSEISVSAPVFAMIVFHGCSPGGDGKCNVGVTFAITSPDGSVYDKPVTADAWGDVPPPGMNLQASLASMGFQLEPTDKLGTYLISATLVDRIAGKSVTMFEEVEAVADRAPDLPIANSSRQGEAQQPVA